MTTDAAGAPDGVPRCVTTLPGGVTWDDRAPRPPRPRSLAHPPPALVGVGSLAARAYLTVLAGLLFWSVAPLLFGMSPVVVRTGSMQPAVRPGDVLLVQRMPASSVRPGQVVLAVNPARPDELLSHRVVRVNADGGLVTRGDANGSADSTPVPATLVKGVARLRVPFVGRPAVWWWDGHRASVLSWLVLSGLAVVLAGAGPRGGDAPSSPGPRAGVRVPVLRRRAWQTQGG